MHVHAVAFKWKADASSEEIEAALATLKEVKNHVPGLLGVFVGPNLSTHGEGFAHAIVVVGEDEEALSAYRSHPLHLEAANAIRQLQEIGVGIDLDDRF